MSRVGKGEQPTRPADDPAREIALLRAENQRLRAANRAAYQYIRSKVDDLLGVLGTRSLRPEELDDQQIIEFDPVGIVADAFRHVLDNLRETNNQLSLARDELQAVFDSVGAGLLVLDGQRRVVAYNETCREQFFTGREIEPGCDCQAAVCRGEGSGRCLFETVLDTGREAHTDNWRLAGRTYNVIGRPLHDEQGRISNVVLAYTDVSARRKAEVDLRRALNDAQQAREKLDGILHSAADGLLVSDAQGRIVLINQKAADLLGISLAGFRPGTPFTALPDQRLVDLVGRLPAGNLEVLTEDLVFAGSHDQERIFQARATAIRGARGGLRGSITFLHEVTREREVERLKSEFVSTAAHEFRTPLATIIGYTDLLLVQAETPAELRAQYLELIQSKAERLAEIVSDLLDISRIESGEGLKLSLQSWSLRRICMDALGECSAGHSGHRFEVDLPEQDVELRIDRFATSQVLENLLSNAIKYSPQGGVIRLAAEVDGAYCRLTLSDQGLGMNPDQLTRVFEKFYRADASNTAIPGTGLGMTIVKHLVEAQGGSVRVESEPGVGTRVQFCLPLHG